MQYLNFITNVYQHHAYVGKKSRCPV